MFLGGLGLVIRDFQRLSLKILGLWKAKEQRLVQRKRQLVGMQSRCAQLGSKLTWAAHGKGRGGGNLPQSVSTTQ